MGLIRWVGVVALLVACDKGKIEPTKGSAQPLPTPDPAPVPADAARSEDIDEMLLNGRDPDAVWVRACNDTGKKMDALEWHEGFKASAIGKGECTRYDEASGIYSYTFAKFNLSKDEFIIQPIDYVGETPLTPGLYSFHITVVDYGHRTADIRAKLDATTTRIDVRVCNDSNQDFTLTQVQQALVVDHGGDLKRQSCTPYYETKHALDTTAASFSIGADKFSVLPTRDVGVRSLNPGKWSYRLSITSAHEARVVVKQDPW